MLKWRNAAVAYLAALTLFTGWVLLDTFVIPRSYGSAQTATAEQIAARAETPDDVSAPVITDSSYEDGSVSVHISQARAYESDIYVADIVLSSADALKTAFAEDTYGKNVTETASAIAAAHNAILAINGDYYGARSGYVIRNGVLYRSVSAGKSQQDLVIYADGSFEIIAEGDVSAQELLERGAWQVLSFGPGLVENGAVTATGGSGGHMASANPRTAIGIIDSLHYVFVVADGRTDQSDGLTLGELAAFMQRLGVQTAYNLDGGGSSTMVFAGGVVNVPTSNGRSVKERSVSDIVYIG